MSAMKHLVWAAGLAVALLGSTATKAEAAYASVVVRNPGDVTIHYQIKWGSGEWKNYSVEPGERRYHAWDLDEDDDVPDLNIRFDCIANDGKITFETYQLSPTVVRNPFNGRSYVFRWEGRLLDLFKD